MAQGYRPSRVADQMRAELSDLLAREVHDPGIGFITITRVHVTPDLGLGRIFYTTLGTAAARKETARALRRAAPFLRRQIGHRLRLRRVPELEFLFDESIEQQDRLERIFQEIHAADEAHEGPEGGDPTIAAEPDHDGE
jgi:ribosome-binding factor A